MRSFINVLLLGTLLVSATHVYAGVGESVGRKIVKGVSTLVHGDKQGTAYITGEKSDELKEKKKTKKAKRAKTQDDSAKATQQLKETELKRARTVPLSPDETPGTTVLDMSCDQEGCWGLDRTTNGNYIYMKWPEDAK